MKTYIVMLGQERINEFDTLEEAEIYARTANHADKTSSYRVEEEEKEGEKVMKKETLKDNLKTAISQLGGIKAVTDRFEIPYRTVQNWSDGVRTPPTYVARMILEVEKQDRRNDESYKDYVEEQEALSWYEKELKKEQQKTEELEAKNRELQEQFNTMNEIADAKHYVAEERSKEIESNESTIDQLIAANEALKKELEKERKAREFWASQAARYSNW